MWGKNKAFSYRLHQYISLSYSHAYVPIHTYWYEHLKSPFYIFQVLIYIFEKGSFYPGQARQKIHKTLLIL